MTAPGIFREYDIRGIWGEDLTAVSVRAIGRAFAFYLINTLSRERLTVTVGRDVRLSSPEVFLHLTEGLLESGIDVIDVGVCPTPLQYFSLYKLNADGGVMITGSHNPPEYNGMKLTVGRETIHGAKIRDIRRLTEDGSSVRGNGRMHSHNIIPEYIAQMKDAFTGFEKIKVVVDAGNGTGGLVAPALLRELGCDVVELFCEPDGTFPNHHPDPVVLGNLQSLVSKVRTEHAALGIGYDGDADRIGVVDEDGDVVWGDRLMIIFSRDLLKENKGATIIGEVKCSQTMFDDIEANNGKAIMWKVGHSLLKSKMKETGALLAGEMSGHIFFADRYFGYDDAIYASLRLIEILSKTGRPYSVKSLLSGIPPVVSTPEIRFDCPDELKFGIVEKAKAAFSDYPLFDIDGIRISFENGWGLIRASNTQPALVMRFEAADTDSLMKIRTLVEERLKSLL